MTVQLKSEVLPRSFFGKTMQRRRFLAGAATLIAGTTLPVFSAFAHTPYGQWDIFRKRNLQLLTSHADYIGDDLGDEWVATLRAKLPLSHAMVSRAHDMPRVAALLKTNQSKLAVLSYLHARLMFAGTAPFENFAPLPLEILVDNGKYFLVAIADLPLHHGYLIATALMEDAARLNLKNPAKGKFGMVVHPGARAYYKGEKLEMPDTSAEL